MEKTFNMPRFTFESKERAKDFLNSVRKMIYLYDVATANDVLILGGNSPSNSGVDGFHYGYAKKDIRKVSPVKISKAEWIVELPVPKRMIRGSYGHWTTEEPEEGE